MGKLIHISSNYRPHCDLVYEGEGESRKCFIVCECGARLEIGSFRHSWSIIETRVKWEAHLEEAHKPA